MTVDLRRLAAEVGAALPPLDAGQRRVGLAVYRLIAAGEPASAGRIALLAGMDPTAVATVVGSLPTATVLDGTVTAFLGLQREAGRHRLGFGEQSLATWCAWDTLFLPALVGRAGRAQSRCPVTGDLVTVEVDPELGVTSASPAGALLSFVAHPEPFSGSVIAGFCQWIHFLADAPAAEAWVSGAAWAAVDSEAPDHPELAVLTLDEGVALGRLTNLLVFGEQG